MSFRDLTPGEALVLLDPNKSQGKEAVKVSLMWLLAKKHLTASLEDRPGFWGQFLSKKTYLRTDGNVPADLPADLRAVRGLAMRAGAMDEFITAARAEYGTELNGFVQQIIIPSLMRRGLLEARTDTVLFVFPRTRYFRTPTGEASQQNIEKLMMQAREIPDFLDRSPAQAAAVVASLGALVLIMPELRSHFSGIADAMRRRHTTDSSYVSDSSGGLSSSSSSPATEDKPFEFEAFDAAGFETFDASMSALDSGFDAASSGGDGGGGDGGGGGGD